MKRLKNSITTEQAEKLLEKYYSGSTSGEEEKLLARFLSQPDLPVQFAAERAMFAYFKGNAEVDRRKLWMPRFVKLGAAVAAVVVLVLYTTFYSRGFSTDFAYVDGEKITNKVEVRRFAQMSFENISSQNNEVEFGLETINTNNIIDNELDVFAEIEF